MIWELIGVGLLMVFAGFWGFVCGHNRGVSETEKRWSDTVHKDEWIRRYRPDLLPK